MTQFEKVSLDRIMATFSQQKVTMVFREKKFIRSNTVTVSIFFCLFIGEKSLNQIKMIHFVDKNVKCEMIIENEQTLLKLR